MTRSKRLPCAYTTTFSQTSLFLDRFSRKFWISKSATKNRTLEKSVSDVLSTFTSSFCNYRTSEWMRARAWGTVLFLREKFPKMMLKITWSTPLHKLSIGYRGKYGVQKSVSTCKSFALQNTPALEARIQGISPVYPQRFMYWLSVREKPKGFPTREELIKTMRWDVLASVSC